MGLGRDGPSDRTGSWIEVEVLNRGSPPNRVELGVRRLLLITFLQRRVPSSSSPHGFWSGKLRTLDYFEGPKGFSEICFGFGRLEGLWPFGYYFKKFSPALYIDFSYRNSIIRTKFTCPIQFMIVLNHNKEWNRLKSGEMGGQENVKHLEECSVSKSVFFYTLFLFFFCLFSFYLSCYVMVLNQEVFTNIIANGFETLVDIRLFEVFQNLKEIWIFGVE